MTFPQHWIPQSSFTSVVGKYLHERLNNIANFNVVFILNGDLALTDATGLLEVASATPGPAACYVITHMSSANIWTLARLSGELCPRITQPHAGSPASTHVRNNPLSKSTNLESSTDVVLLCHHSWFVSFNYQVPRFNLNFDVTSRNSKHPIL